jgi:hypothetical protein
MSEKIQAHGRDSRAVAIARRLQNRRASESFASLAAAVGADIVGSAQDDGLRMISTKAIALISGLLLGWVTGAHAAAGDRGARVAFFGFRLINTSLEPTTAAEDARIGQLDQLFREKVEASRRYMLMTVPPEMQQEIAAGPGIDGCNGCERELARKVGAELAAWGTVQKVSNLILNINVYLRDVETGTMTFARSVDIRGNNDVAWQRGLDYLLGNYLLGNP